MEKIVLNLPGTPSVIYVGKGLTDIRDLIPEGRHAIITDSNILRHYGERFPDAPVIVLEPGEQSKSMDTLVRAYDQLVTAGLDRKSFIIGIGGGVVCDVAGFVASTFLRGVPFGFIATSLLAQVDAGIGGKNGINFRGYKNIIGVIKQPEFIICELDMLDTLDNSEYLGGFAEIIKYGAIRDADLFTFLETNFKLALQKDKEILLHLVAQCVRIKCAVVEADQFEESGVRKILNYGHTFGHAMEKIYGISHGEAVSLGMVIATEISVKTGLLRGEEGRNITGLIRAMGLPVSRDLDMEAMIEAIGMDKKRSGDKVGLVLLDRIGNAVVKDFGFVELRKLLYDLHKPGT
jgi:3-dehydroquinate synthase